ncbi:hypothetical protein C5167_028363 [Papaver somniferum]|nr:hypothetical protein C5167_028363 [Papaver somniferum]
MTRVIPLLQMFWVGRTSQSARKLYPSSVISDCNMKEPSWFEALLGSQSPWTAHQDLDFQAARITSNDLFLAPVNLRCSLMYGFASANASIENKSSCSLGNLKKLQDLKTQRRRRKILTERCGNQYISSNSRE